MSVQLTREQEELVRAKLETGRYGSAGEVVSDALRLLSERDRLLELTRDEVHTKISAGLKSLDEGKGTDGESVLERLDAELDHLERSGHA
ncbi:type II toxin-antitoxin system ParD family antitoxin [Alloacidobacterium dinghuense]|uniref:Type II toxin-antitoxin system ParD family antitoxin n=1 Tax=Alloacidobacterium dinghuense TaxID=2763107 RepID=A0A7G8BDR5_9BACT|nr:type II toxin-antitoxin system ParD family antitoxin [Alloacidobacterium dinghuense]QNI30685.1 type II toxin-antitoxin system ParD family antitoxin [Alloacidobacterium dinghuense]